MKNFLKILVVTVVVSILCSCDKNKERVEKYEDITVDYKTVNSSWSVFEITYNGETHEFIEKDGAYGIGIVHWPGCKFCKEKETSKTDNFGNRQSGDREVGDTMYMHPGETATLKNNTEKEIKIISSFL